MIRRRSLVDEYWIYIYILYSYNYLILKHINFNQIQDILIYISFPRTWFIFLGRNYKILMFGCKKNKDI